MMKRFYFGSDDERDDDEADSFDMPSPSEFISMGEIESPFKSLMECSIRVCERSVMWRFLSAESKLKMINSVFAGLSAIEREYETDADIRDEM